MKYKLSEIMDLIGGGTPKTSVAAYWGGDIPWLSVKDFNNDNRYVYETEKTITQEGLNNSSTKLLERDDSIISARGTVGEMAMIPFPMAFNQSCYGLRAKKEIVDPTFLYYLVKHNVYVLQKNTHGSVFDTITRDTFAGIDVDVPEMDTQIKIAGILRDLDDKIELNTNINKNLEQQAQALFRNQFLSRETLPDGWTKATLGEVSLMGAGGDKPKTVSATQTENCPYPIYSNGISDEGLYGFTDEYKIKDESITVSARGTIGFVCLRHIPYTPIVRLVTLVPNTDVLSAKYLYLWLKNSPIHGTGTTQQQLTVPDFRKTEIVLPTKEEMDSFTDTVTPLFEAIWANQVENTKLSNMRDVLLPKLMSGELDVSELDI